MGAVVATWDEMAGERRPPRSRLPATLGIALLSHALLFALLVSVVPSRDIAATAARVHSLGVRLMQPAGPSHVVPAPAPAPRPPKPLPPEPAPRTSTAPSPTPLPVATPSDAVAGDAHTPAAEVPATAPAADSPSPAAEPQARSIARVDTRYGANPRPAYPRLSLSLGEEGQVVLRVRVSAEGAVLGVDVSRSSGYPRLDEAARRAVAGWRFIPAHENGAGVESTVVFPLTFSLDS